MLQTLPSELILSIASHASPETKGTIAQTCRTCYSVLMPLLWRYLPLKAIENIDGIVNRLVRNNWLSLATQFVHAITLTSDSVRHNTLEEIQSLTGAMESGYPYLFDHSTPLDLILPTKSKKSFGDIVYDLIQHFPQTSSLTFDFYLALPYLLPNRASDDTITTTTTNFTGGLAISHYRPGQVQALAPLLTPFPQLSQLSIKAQAALSYSDDKEMWLIGDADVRQLYMLPMDHLRYLHIKDVNDNVQFDTYRNLLDSKPNLQSLTLQWRYRPTKLYVEALTQLVDTMPEWYIIESGSDDTYSICLTRYYSK